MKGLLARAQAYGVLLAGVVSCAVVSCAVVSCAGPATQIVSDTRELSESTHAPSFRSVEDVGPSDVLMKSPLAPQPSDGVAVVGELLWLHGSDFGRRPTVLVADQSVPVLARTQDEGVVVRVPPGAPAGPQTVVLSTEHGEARAPFTIVRRVIVHSPTDGRIVALTEGPEGPEGPVQPLSETLNASVAAFAASEEGRAIYTLEQPADGPARVSVVALAAQGGGRAVAALDLAAGQVGAAWALDVATFEGHAALFVLGEKGLVTFDLSSPLRPVSRGQVSLSWPRPLGPRGLRRFAVSGDGRWLALADGADSAVTLLALGQSGGRGESATLAGTENLLPDLRANAIAALAFARDGRRLFVLVGPTTDGARVGNPEPTRLFTLTPAADRRRWTVSGSLPLADIKWPTTLREARVRHLQSGASIRRPSTTLPLFVAGQSAEGPQHAAVLRIDGEQIKNVATFPGSVVGLADAPDARWWVATVVDRAKGPAGAAQNSRLVGFVVDDRPGATRTVPLDGGTSGPRPVSQNVGRGVGKEEAPRRFSVEVQP